MQIRIWNAYASNNSGSYTLVGSFPSEDEAAKVAAELTPVLQAHTEWIHSEAKAPSPLSLLVSKVGIDWEANRGSDEWPLYGGTDTPAVLALGHQVLIHHDYTVTLPEALGHYFYRRGGAVDLRLDHTHDVLVALFEIWWPWDSDAQEQKPMHCAAIAAELARRDGAFHKLLSDKVNPAWRIDPEDSEHPLILGAVFTDLVAGCEAVRQILLPHGCGFRLKIFERLPGQRDPLAFLR